MTCVMENKIASQLRQTVAIGTSLFSTGSQEAVYQVKSEMYWSLYDMERTTMVRV